MPSEVNSPTVRAAIYVRVSSDLLSPASIDDQLRVCAERAAKEGWEVVESYIDQGIPGTSLSRRGILKLLEDAARTFDIILTESLDRLSRDQEDLATSTSACASGAGGSSPWPKARQTSCTSAQGDHGRALPQRPGRSPGTLHDPSPTIALVTDHEIHPQACPCPGPGRPRGREV
jgi:Resolvase, N terminal domain